MSEEFKMQLAAKVDKSIENKKSVAWAGLGVAVYHKELELQILKQTAFDKLPVVTTENIKQCEDALALLKTDLTNIEASRKQITGKFLKVTKTLMEPENEISEKVKTFSNELLEAKKQALEKQKTNQQKQKEITEVAEKVRIYVSDMHTAYLNAQAKLIKDSYDHALATNIPASSLEAYKAKILTRVNVTNTTTPLPKIPALYNDQAAIDAEIKKHFNPWQPQQYINGFKADLDDRFDDWELALKNKEQAKKINENEFKQNTESINELNNQEKIAAKLDTFSAPPLIEFESKKLKSVWQIANDETIENALKICNAFIVNQAKCIPELQIKKAFNLGIEQMKKALEKLKSEDENFECTGIIFKQIEKL